MLERIDPMPIGGEGLCLGPTGLEKALGTVWVGVGLRLKEQKGPRRPPTSGLIGQGTSPGSPAGFLGLSGQGNCTPLLSCSSWMTRPACLS